MEKTAYWIGGAWRESADALPVINPYNGREIGATSLATPEDVEDALSAAAAAYPVMRRLPGHRRAAILARISAGIQARAEEMARTITLEAGKPIRDARGEVARAVNTFQVAAEEAKRIGGEVIPLDWAAGSEGRIGITRRQPVGPILGISPFNFPLNLVAHKIAPAIASGNPILLKPAPKTPLTALLLARIISDTDLPRGAVSIFPCANTLAGALVSDRRIKMISFTGSVPVGWSIKAKAVKKKVILELGGNAGVIIQDDADLDYAAKRCALGGFAYAGQVCISVQRIFVQASAYAPFMERFLPLVKAISVGDPMDEATGIGPMISREAAERAEGWIKEAVSKGAKILAGGRRDGAALAPTVLGDTGPEMAVNCVEVFAPIVTVSRYETLDDAIRQLNNSPYGLQAGLFARDIKAVFSAFDAIDVGGLIVNDVPTYRVDHMPYGGVKESGVGREGVRYAIEEMTELKLMALNLQ